MDAHPEETLRRENKTAGRLRERICVSHMSLKERTVVLIGAGAGPLAFEASKHAKRVFAFEPDFGLFGSLRRNLHKCNYRNVAFYKEAIGDKVGTTRMDPRGVGEWRVDINGTASVMQTTIDALELDDCGAIIINGDCGDLMRGADKTLGRFAPHVVAL